MKVTCQINDYTNPMQTEIRVHNHWCHGMVEVEVDGIRRSVNGNELIEAIRNCLNDNK